MINRPKLAAALVFVLLASVGVGAALMLGGVNAGGSEPVRPSFHPAPKDEAEPVPAAGLKGSNRYLVARVSGRQVVYSRPGGRPRLHIADKTEWRTPRVLSVVKHRRGWLAVLLPDLKNGRLGWIRTSQVRRLDSVAWSLHADLSKRQLVVRRDGKRVRRFRVGVGRTGHPTPTGRFAVTDRLRVSDSSSPYGCCILALTGHQTRLPPGWPGGDRLAIHGTANLSGLGHAVSLGCIRSDPKDVRWLMKRVPLGTPVFVRA